MEGWKANKAIKYVCLVLVMFVLGCCAGCGRGENSSQEEESGLLQVYLLSKDKTALIPVAYTGDAEQLLGGMVQQLAAIPADIDYKAPLQMGFEVLEYRCEGNVAVLDFDDGYYKLSRTDEILVRAALVKTITQVPGIEYVSIQVNGEPLVDGDGQPAGEMSADDFVDAESIARQESGQE